MRRLNANTHLKTASPLLAVEFRLVVEILISGLPTIRELLHFNGHKRVYRYYSFVSAHSCDPLGFGLRCPNGQTEFDSEHIG